jgi:hypothetical protein
MNLLREFVGRVTSEREKAELLSRQGVTEADHTCLGSDEDVFVNAWPWVAGTENDVSQSLAVTLHEPFPVNPWRTEVTYTRDDVEEGMDSGTAEVDTGGKMTIV